MLRFACPTCKTVLQIAESQAGAAVACPTCKTRLQAPQLPTAPAPISASPAAAPPTPSPDLWYYTREGKSIGPVSRAQLRALAAAGEIKPADVVCSAASPQWVPASSVLGTPSPSPSVPASQPTARAGFKGLASGFVRETGETVRGTWEQTRRLAEYGKRASRRGNLRLAASRAALAFGERMVQAGAGDPALRGRIAAVDEQIRTAEAAKQSTRALRAEREALVRQLVAPATAWAASPPGLEAEHARLRDAEAALRDHAETLKTARTSLPPSGATAWRRVLIGYGGLLLVGGLVLLGAVWMFRPTTRVSPVHPPADPPLSLTPPPGTLYVLEKPVWTAKGGQFWGAASRLAFLPDGKTLLARGDNGEARVYGVEKGEESPATGFLVRAKYPGLKNLAFGWEDEALFARYLVDDRQTALQDGIRSVAKQSSTPLDGARKFLSPDGKTLATAVAPLPLRLWDAETGNARTLELQAEDTETDGSYHAFSIAFSPDGKKLAVWGKSGLKVWDLGTSKLLAILTRETPGGGTEAPITFSPDGALLAANRPADHTPPTIWNTAMWDVRCALKLGGGGNFQVRAFSPDHKLVVTTDGSTKYYVTTWDAETGKMLHRTDAVDAHEVLFSPDGTLLIAGGGEFFVKNEPLHDVLVWDAASGRVTHRLSDDQITAIAVAPDGTFLATGNKRSEVKLWDLTRGKPIPVEGESPGSGTRDDPIKLTAFQLYSDYTKDPTNAEQRYFGRWLAVTGQVVTRDDSPANFPGAILIGLRGSPTDGERVSCYLDRVNAGQLKRLDDPDYPPLIGECSGLRAVEEGSLGKKKTVQLTHCFVPGK